MGLLYSHYEANPNITSNTTNNLKINAVSGTLTKTFDKSYFVRFERNSQMEKFYFRENKPSRIIEISDRYLDDYDEKFNDRYYKLKEIVILQIMLCADNQFLVEAIDKDDYNKIFVLESKGE